MRLPGPRPLAAAAARPAARGGRGSILRDAALLLRGGSRRTLALAGLAALFVSFDSAVLVLALPAIAADFRTSIPALTGLGAVVTLGSIAGLPIAVQADRLGRRRLLVAAVAGFSLANLASAWSPTLAWLAAARTAAVALETVASAVTTALVIEETEPAQRGLAVAAITVAAGAGTGATTLLYPLVAPHWRTMYLVGASGLAAAVVLAVLLRESAAWSAAVAEAGAAPRLPVRLLLAPPWRGRLAVVAGAAFLGLLLYEPAGLLFALFGSRVLGLGPPAISAVTVVSGVASVPAFLVGGRLSDRVGRRPLAVALGVATACFTALSFSGGRPAYWGGNVLWSVLASATAPILGAWYGELFPTRARATSESLVAVAGALGGAAGFRLVGLLQPLLGFGPSLALPAAAAVAGALLLLLLPETRGRPLEA